ncbi:hypothetical protein B296_00030072, partial [Ensete ventricosum]
NCPMKEHILCNGVDANQDRAPSSPARTKKLLRVAHSPSLPSRERAQICFDRGWT